MEVRQSSGCSSESLRASQRPRQLYGHRPVCFRLVHCTDVCLWPDYDSRVHLGLRGQVKTGSACVSLICKSLFTNF